MRIGQNILMALAVVVVSLGVAGAKAQTTAPAPTAKYDLVLKGGHVIDPANSIDEKMDVGVSAGKIAAVAKNIPADQAGKIVDVTGLYVTPGLIDIHVHIGHGGAPLEWFTPQARIHTEPYGIPADIVLQSGVTTIVDAGTSGTDSFLYEKEEVMDRARVRVLAFLNIVADGMSGGLEQSVEQMNVKRCVETIKKYPNLIVGVKTAHFWTEQPEDPAHPLWAAVDRAEECATAASVPVMVDFWPREGRSYADLILKKMRPGDIHTHVFAQQFPIILEDGKINPIMAQARARGVLFDVGHGAGSFWFRNAVPAVKQGFVPDSISTDLHMEDFVTLSFSNVMSKLLSMGVPLNEVIRRSTVNPAKEIRRPELGTLTVGSEADIAVLDNQHGHFGFIDCGRARMNGTEQVVAKMTVRAGRIVFDPTGMSMVEWEKARPQYFKPPALQNGAASMADDFPR